MSIEQNPDTSQVPDKMDYHDHERELAREVQARHAAEKRKKQRRNRIIASVAGASVLAGGAAVFGLSRGGDSTEPRAEASTSASQNPGEESPAPAETDAPLAEFAISAEQYPDYASAIPALVQAENDYVMSGTLVMDEPGNEQYLVALFGADYQSNPDVASNVEELIQDSVGANNALIATQVGENEYKVDYEVTDISNVQQIGDNEYQGEIVIHSTDNAMETTLAGVTESGENANLYAKFVYAIKNVDGQWIITKVQPLGEVPATN